MLRITTKPVRASNLSKTIYPQLLRVVVVVWGGGGGYLFFFIYYVYVFAHREILLLSVKRYTKYEIKMLTTESHHTWAVDVY